MSPFDRIWAIMTKPRVIIGYSFIVILSFLYFDKWLLDYFNQFEVSQHLVLMQWITKLGLGVIYLPTLFILALFFRYIYIERKYEARAWFVFICVIIPDLICSVLKVVCGRARPLLWVKEGLYGFYGFKWQASFWSFPSGHTTTIMSLVFALSIVFPNYGYLFIVPGLVISLSRVLLMNHYLSDVLATIYLSLLAVGGLHIILQRNLWLTPGWKYQV